MSPYKVEAIKTLDDEITVDAEVLAAINSSPNLLQFVRTAS